MPSFPSATEQLALLGLPESCPTVVDVIAYWAARSPEHVAFVFLGAGDRTTELTYGELWAQVRSRAAYLQQTVRPGERLLLVYPYEAGLEFICGFCGCLAAGAIAVTCHPPRHRSGTTEVSARLQDSGAVGILTTAKQQASLQKSLAELPENCRWFAHETSTAAATAWQQRSYPLEATAFLQYTSGSTGRPKGVVVTHACLLHNQATIQQAFGNTRDTVGASWLPLFHDMGLIGTVLQPLYLGATSVLMSPQSFILQPSRWLQAISTYRANTSGGPNFAYDLLCRHVTDAQRADLDLSCWHVAFSGGEPVRPKTIAAFVERFGPCGFKGEAFYPCYGLAEATLFVTGGSRDSPPVVRTFAAPALAAGEARAVQNDDGRELVSSGYPWLGTTVQIVAPDTQQALPAGKIGEIWVAGLGIGRSYWQNPTGTAATFEARLQGATETFLRTGDLGFLATIDGQAELFVTGRQQDVLVFWGLNHYPDHIERTIAACHPGFEPAGCAAIAVPIAGEERLVVVQEVRRQCRSALRLTEAIAQMRQQVFAEHFIELYGAVLVKPGALPRTSSGKIRRQACRGQFLAQELAAIDTWQLPDGVLSDPTAAVYRYYGPLGRARLTAAAGWGNLQRWLAVARGGKP